MKVLKNITILFFALSLMIVSSGCNSGIYDDIDAYKNGVIPIYNARNEEIGSIECYGYSVLVNGCILYTRLPGKPLSSHSLEYCLYNIETKQNYSLSVIDDWSYEASYEIIKSNDHLYLSIFSGEYIDFENGKQTIYDIDLLEHSMLPILEIEGGVPYNSYTIANNKLVLSELLYNGYTDLVEYDLSEPYTSTVVHKYDETDFFTQNRFVISLQTTKTFTQ